MRELVCSKTAAMCRWVEARMRPAWRGALSCSSAGLALDIEMLRFSGNLEIAVSAKHRDDFPPNRQTLVLTAVMPGRRWLRDAYWIRRRKCPEEAGFQLLVHLAICVGGRVLICGVLVDGCGIKLLYHLTLPMQVEARTCHFAKRGYLMKICRLNLR